MFRDKINIMQGCSENIRLQQPNSKKAGSLALSKGNKNVPAWTRNLPWLPH